ncbi:MAG: hypothetical protein KAF27_08630 [Porphyrobacter sp.]|nr:hypothetical protein [Porphyrobacter sp.]
MFSLLLAAALQQAAADVPPAPDSAEAVNAELAAPAPADPAPVIALPAATPIIIAVDAELGSKISATGQMFPIRLAKAVVVDGVEVLPAGITGEGQVVHAKKAGLAGAAGELVLAARYLDYNGRRIELRSFRFMEAGETSLGKGQDNTGMSNMTTAIAGPIGFFIGGGNTNVLPGTIANAKTRNVEVFAAPAAAPAPPENP